MISTSAVFTSSKDLTFSSTSIGRDSATGQLGVVKVIKILEFGAVVEFRPGKEVLLHVSEIAWERVEKVEKYLNLGDITRVKYMGIDSRTKKQKVSRKILLERPKKKE